MAYQLINGRYQVPLVDFGKQLQSRGWNVAEHSAFGGVTAQHAPNSYHNYDEALDITWKNNEFGDFDPSGQIGWADWTDQLGGRLAGAGPEVLHRSKDAKGHGTHVHLAAKNGMLNLTAEQMADFGLMDSPAGAASVGFNQADGGQARSDAKQKAKDFSQMSKAELNAAYDANRDKEIGMQMHKAYFGKP